VALDAWVGTWTGRVTSSVSNYYPCDGDVVFDVAPGTGAATGTLTCDIAAVYGVETFDLRGTFGATSASGRLASSGVFGPMIGAWADWSGLPV
jgi:hypothetical protein